MSENIKNPQSELSPCRDCGTPCDEDYCPVCALMNTGDLTAALAYAESHPSSVRHPGKFEGCDDYRVAMVLHAMSLEGSYCDAEAVDDGVEWYGAIGRYVVSEDSQGFVWYVRESSAGVARAKVESLGVLECAEGDSFAV